MKFAIVLTLLTSMFSLSAFAGELKNKTKTFKCDGLVKTEEGLIRKASIKLTQLHKMENSRVAFSLQVNNELKVDSELAEVSEDGSIVRLTVKSSIGDDLAVSIQHMNDVEAPFYYWVKIEKSEGALTCNK